MTFEDFSKLCESALKNILNIQLIGVKILQGYIRHWQQARVLGDGVSGTIWGDLCSFGGHFLRQSGLI